MPMDQVSIVHDSVIPVVRQKPEIRLFRHFPKFRPKSIQRKAGKVRPDKKPEKLRPRGMPLIWLSPANFTDPRIPDRGRNNAGNRSDRRPKGRKRVACKGCILCPFPLANAL